MAEKRNAECGDLCFDSESGLWHYSAFQRRASHCPSGNTAVLCGAGALAQAAQRLWGLLLGDLQKSPECGSGHPAALSGPDTEAPSNLSNSMILEIRL